MTRHERKPSEQLNALRRMPSHWRLDKMPPDYIEQARILAWLIVRAVVVATALMLLYAAASAVVR